MVVWRAMDGNGFTWVRFSFLPSPVHWTQRREQAFTTTLPVRLLLAVACAFCCNGGRALHSARRAIRFGGRATPIHRRLALVGLHHYGTTHGTRPRQHCRWRAITWDGAHLVATHYYHHLPCTMDRRLLPVWDYNAFMPHHRAYLLLHSLINGPCRSTCMVIIWVSTTRRLQRLLPDIPAAPTPNADCRFCGWHAVIHSGNGDTGMPLLPTPPAPASISAGPHLLPPHGCHCARLAFTRRVTFPLRRCDSR